MKWDLKDITKTRKYNNLNKERVHQYCIMAGIQAYSDVSLSTPVDTGRARYSWYCSVSAIDYTETPPGQWVLDPTRAAKAFASSKPGQSLFIANSTPYIEYLNQGSSRQAPARFVETTVERVQRNANRLLSKTLTVTG